MTAHHAIASQFINKLQNNPHSATVGLAILAILGNHLHQPLFFGVDILFGSIPAFLALYWRGPRAALIIALCGGLYTWHLWHHPYALILLTLEIAAVAWLGQQAHKNNRSTPSLIVAVTLYWITLGIPLVILCYRHQLAMPWSAVTLIALKQTLNSLLNAGAASLILILTRLTRQAPVKPTLANIIEMTLLLSLTAPALAITVWSTGTFKDQLEQDYARQLQFIGQLALNHNQTHPNQAPITCCNTPTSDPAFSAQLPLELRDILHLMPINESHKPTNSRLQTTAIPGLMLAIPTQPLPGTQHNQNNARMNQWRTATYQRIVTAPPPQQATTNNQATLALPSYCVTLAAAPLIDQLQQQTINNLALLLLLTLSAIAIAQRSTSWLRHTFTTLTQTTQALPTTIASGTPAQHLAPTRLADIAELSNAINTLGQALTNSFATLNNERQRFADIIEGTQAGTWSWDLTTNQTIVDNQMAKLLGYPLAELSPGTPNTWFQLIHPDDMDQVNHAINQHLDGTTSVYETEFRARRKDGRWIWLYSRGRIVKRNPDSTPQRLSGIDLDITDRKQAEQALRAERDLFSAGPVFTILWQATPDWPVRQVSSNVQAILGYPSEALITGVVRYSDLIHPDDRDRVNQNLHASTKQHHHYEQSYRLKRRDGVYRWFYEFSQYQQDDATHNDDHTPSSSNQTRPLLKRSYLFDQTHSKEAETILEQQRQRLEDILTGTQAGTWEWTIPTGAVQFNDRWAEIIGYRLNELAPITVATWLDHVHLDDFQHCEQQLHRHWQKASPYYDCELRMRHREGHWVWVQDRGCVVTWTTDDQPLIMRGTRIDISERKHAEQALRASEALSRQILDNADVGLVRYHRHGIHLTANPAYANLIDQPLTDIINNSIQDVLEPSTYAALKPYIERVLQGEHIRFEHTIRSANPKKSNRTAHISYAPSIDANGSIIGWLACFTDITDRKQAEIALAHSQKRFQDIVEASADGIWEVDLTGRYSYVSASISTLYGVQPEDLLGRSPFDFMPAAEAARVQACFADFLAQQAPFRDLDNVCINANGEYIDLQTTGIPIIDHDGQLRGYRGIGRDVTATKRAERALQTNQKLLRALIDSLPDLIFMKDPDGVYLICNPRFEQLFGSREADIIGKTDHDFVDAVTADAFDKADQAAIQAGRPYRFEETVTFASDGHHEILQTIKIPVFDSDQQLIGLLGIGRDITAIKQAEQALIAHRDQLEDLVTERTADLIQARTTAEQLAAAKSDFLASMSHEIRTPMNAVLGLAYLLSRQPLPDQALTMVNKIQTAGQSLLALLNDILDLSKIEAGKIDLEQRPFQLSDVLDNLATIMANTAQHKTIDLIIQPPVCSDWQLQGDPLRLGQILINLTSNAIKFTEVGSVTVIFDILEHHTSELRLRGRVCDTGLGLDAATQARLFQPFTQAERSTQRRFGGTGLGLAITRRLVDAMGGRIGVDSVPNQGSTFWFELPLTILRRSPPERPTPVLMHSLILSDDASIYDALRNTVTALGWFSYYVDTCKEAITLIEQTPWLQGSDTVLLIACHPDAASYASARAIRTALTERCPLLCVVVSHNINGKSMNGDERGMRDERVGASDDADIVLTQPVTPSPLYNAVLQFKDTDNPNPSTIAEPSRSTPTSNRLAGLHILVVDDNAINRDVALGILEDEGAQVSLAEDGQQAIDWLHAQTRTRSLSEVEVRLSDKSPRRLPVVATKLNDQTRPSSTMPDIILMDIQMPILDGLAATRQIRQDRQLNSLPVIALTAGALPEQQTAALAAGINDFLAKPIQVDVAITLIQQTLHITQTATANTAMTTNAPADTRSSSPATHFPGLDIAFAISIWRTPERYQRALRQFSKQLATQFGTIARGDDDPENANNALDDSEQRQAHTLAGAAANLGLTDVAEQARLLEQQWLHNAAPQQRAQTRAILHAAMKQAVASIDGYLDSADAEQSQNANPSAERNRIVSDRPSQSSDDRPQAHIDACLTAIAQACEDFEPHLAEAPLAELAHWLPAEQLSPLAEAIEQLDASAGLKAVQALRDHC
jgi:PAS domain S-box-containing protein